VDTFFDRRATTFRLGRAILFLGLRTLLRRLRVDLRADLRAVARLRATGFFRRADATFVRFFAFDFRLRTMSTRWNYKIWMAGLVALPSADRD